MDSIRLYFKMIRMTVASQMAYKMSFFLMAFGNFAITGIEVLGIYALFSRFNHINGWRFHEVAVFYGLINCSFALAEAIGRGYDVFAQYVREGTFDRILLRPRGISLQILGSEFQLMRVGRLLQGFVVLWVGVGMSGESFDGQGMMLLLFSIIGGTLVFMGLFVLQATMSFWTIQTLEVMNSFTYGGIQMAQYPMDIYRHWFRRLFTVILPIGAVNYFPLMAIFRDGSLVMAYITPVIGCVFFLITQGIFSVGKRYYCSTGS